jgi:hypothetical protein
MSQNSFFFNICRSFKNSLPSFELPIKRLQCLNNFRSIWDKIKQHCYFQKAFQTKIICLYKSFVEKVYPFNRMFEWMNVSHVLDTNKILSLARICHSHYLLKSFSIKNSSFRYFFMEKWRGKNISNLVIFLFPRRQFDGNLSSDLLNSTSFRVANNFSHEINIRFVKLKKQQLSENCC